jgi:hypothetical protein
MSKPITKFFVFCALGLLAVPGVAGAATSSKGGASALGVACSDIPALGIDKQENLRAGLIRVECGLDAPGEELLGSGSPGEFLSDLLNAPTNVDVINNETVADYPHVTQSESMVWASPDGATIVVNYNDSKTAAGNYSGVSVSTDGGASFNRLLPAPFASGHGTNFGDPIVVFNVALNKWFAGDLATGCGGQGIGLWTSTDALTWSVGACAHSGGADDRESFWVDNNAGSPFFGRMYVSWNNFSAGQNIYVVHSDDGVAWSAPVVVSAGFIRNIQLTGSQDSDGTVFIAGMDEHGGFGTATRTNYIYRSTTGGTSWTPAIRQGPDFQGPGTAGLCGYFAAVPPIWRHMGWGQPGVGPGGVVHYAYAGQGANPGDAGDIFYTRSLDNGDTWSDPIVLNSDAASGGNRTQWMPSLSVTPAGQVEVTWFDRRNSTDGTNYEYFGISSADNGASFGGDEAISDVLIHQPEQPDTTVQGCYAGDYNYQTTDGTNSLVTWTDGRNPISGHYQQDVYFASVPQGPPTGGILSGHVASASTGDPISGARILIEGPVNRNTSTNLQGNYQIRLPAGTYNLTVNAFAYLTGTAGGVVVTEGGMTTQDFSLDAAPAHALFGTVVKASDGTPIPNSLVTIMNTPLTPVRTDANGQYLFASVPDGTYNVMASPGSGACIGASTQGVTISQDTELDFALPVRIDGGGYACDDTIAFSWVPGDTDTGITGDDVTMPVPLPFPFTFYGQTYNVIHVSTDGFADFLDDTINFVNQCLPFAGLPHALLAPLWVDLWVAQPGRPPELEDSHIYTTTLGDAPNRIFIIEWRNATFFGQPFTNVATFEILLFEVDGTSIVYQYNRTDGSGDGRGSTIGIENQAGTIATQYSCREANSAAVGKAIWFYHAP